MENQKCLSYRATVHRHLSEPTSDINSGSLRRHDSVIIVIRSASFVQGTAGCLKLGSEQISSADETVNPARCENLHDCTPQTIYNPAQIVKVETWHKLENCYENVTSSYKRGFVELATELVTKACLYLLKTKSL